ncbi:tRNA lysidine(34) synthetase TilS [Staphylococcus schleiferi subsp. coagulans]|uniref:tRNA lysidine(34) synthetase TilS n=1 Tax=Staphylococcus coagulans TaxID=74706 RepID=UPI0015FBD178|nr:tRNA lysidine(34) synthetase TilS [Staphylococcus coagulans]MBA8779180.1 tRNA lysidine(34) synthetase TilS [Staphylococcus coagulans]
MQQNWKATDHLVLAVSTGIDSMVLLHQLLHQYASTYRQLTCLHVHHGLREASHQEALFIKYYCDMHNVPLYIKQLDLSQAVSEGRSIQNDAREMRYQWFDDMMNALGADCLLTAHHQDDQVETIFYRIFTGRSTRSPLGMADSERRNDYRLLKPLLETTKAQIRSYQQTYNVPYFEDESNATENYIRNMIRHRLLPSIQDSPQLQTQHLLKLKSFHDEAQLLMRNEAQSFIENYVTKQDEGFVLPRKTFNLCTPHVKMLILDQLLQEFDDIVTISEKAYFDWFHKLESDVAQTPLMHTHQWHADVVYDQLMIMTPGLYSADSQPLQVNQEGTYHFGLYRIEIEDFHEMNMEIITMRSRHEGDYVTLDSNHHKKVSRLMIDAKVPTQLREQMPIVETLNGDILAVGTLYVRKQYEKFIKIQFLGDDKDEK